MLRRFSVLSLKFVINTFSNCNLHDELLTMKMISMKKLTCSLFIFSAIALASCASAPPKQQDNACVFLKENKSWYRATRATAKKWGAPIGLQLAIIKQESSFTHDAKPERGKRRMLGLLPGKRPSTAYGYAQALDGTWGRIQTFDWKPWR